MSARRSAMRCWTDATLLALGTRARQRSAVMVEASFRTFERITCSDGRSLIAIDAPPERENNQQYCRIAARWGAAGLAVPEVLAADHERGFLLVSDVGRDTLDAHLRATDASGVETAYRRALAQLRDVQALPAETDLYPQYTAARLQAELDIPAQWLLASHGLSSAPLDAVRDLLIDSALAQPQVVVHLDWHSRNLMWRERGAFGIVDFQDARIGPYTYDAVSLLRDCYQRFDEQSVARWAAIYADDPANRNRVTQDFQREFDWMGVQRHLKAVGIFMRMHLRDGKSQHLPHILPTLQRVVLVAGRYAELAPLAEWIGTDLVPRLEAQLPCAP